jgi:hypothetical protein
MMRDLRHNMSFQIAAAAVFLFIHRALAEVASA